MASKPSPIRQTGLGPVVNSSLVGGLIPPRLTPVRASGGPRTPQRMPMPNMGPSFKQTFALPGKVKSKTGAPKRVGTGGKLKPQRTRVARDV